MTERNAAERPSPPSVASRRAVLLGAGAVGAAGIMAACGDGTTTPNPTGAASTAGTGGDAIKAANIPVGGGAIFKEQNVVVTQPTAGAFKAFDATCTHMGCQVSSVANSRIGCNCHGSQYNIADGSVARGPAEDSLSAKTVTLSGDTLTIS